MPRRTINVNIFMTWGEPSGKGMPDMYTDFYRMGLAVDSMALGRHIIHSLAAHYNLKRPLSACTDRDFLRADELLARHGPVTFGTAKPASRYLEELDEDRPSFHERPAELLNLPAENQRPPFPLSLSHRHRLLASGTSLAHDEFFTNRTMPAVSLTNRPEPLEDRQQRVFARPDVPVWRRNKRSSDESTARDF